MKNKRIQIGDCIEDRTFIIGELGIIYKIETEYKYGTRPYNTCYLLWAKWESEVVAFLTTDDLYKLKTSDYRIRINDTPRIRKLKDKIMIENL